ncbi:terminase small subunit [Staphylococcus phage PG-2021_87]
MSAENIRDIINKKKLEEEDTRKYIADGFMNGIGKLMYEFNKKVDNKEIEVKDPNDLYKLFVIFSQMQNMVNETSEGGAIPQLSRPQQELFEEITTEDSNGESTVDLQKIAEMSAEDITEMISEKERIMNEENSETF